VRKPAAVQDGQRAYILRIEDEKSRQNGFLGTAKGEAAVGGE